MYSVLVLLCTIATVQAAKSKRMDGDLVQRDFPIALPVTGFISAKSAFDTVMLKIVRKVNSPGFCKTIEIINQPKPNSSPFVGSSEFTLVTERLYNEHYAWFNGNEYISYIPTEGNHGNWLIGNDPGVDNGYVYLATNSPSLTPINLESTQEDFQWKWLLNMAWKVQPQMRAVCKDVYKPGNVYYEVEYFDQVTREAVKSALVPDLNPYILSLHNQLNQRFDQAEFLSKQSNLLIPFPSYFDQSSRTWKLLEGITVVAEYGSPVLITRSKQQTGTTESHVGILVNEEHSGKLGWRLAFRNYPLGPLEASPTLAAKSGKKVDSISGDDSITQVSYKSRAVTTGTGAMVPSNDVMGTAERDYSEEEETEYTIELDNAGCLDDYRLAPLTSALRKDMQRSTQQALHTVQPGQYVWIWYSTIPNPPKGAGVSVSAEGGLSFTAPALANYDNDWQTDEVSELLLLCKSRNNGTIVFQYFMTDRRDVMKQSHLERDTDFLVMKLATTISSGAYLPPVVSFRGRNVQLKSLVVLGSDIVNYLRRFLLKKEGATHGLSSCYLYHAAVSMPQALIYAAEILCVLLGSKPVAMIQYTTTSDHQWKFPLVRELTSGIVAAKLQLGSALDVSYETFRYRNDETLILYRTGRKYLVDYLMPYHEAQALHPVPYPDDSRLQADWRAQIYNSAWNGFVLGYPGFFVESYCESFHNGLNLEEKRKQLALAERDFQGKMQQGRHPTPKIKLGTDEPIAPSQYELIRSML